MGTDQQSYESDHYSIVPEPSRGRTFVRLERILYLAGYETPPRRNDANVRLKRIHDMLRAGSFDFALEEFLMLYDRTGPTDREFNSDLDGLTAPNFATAVILLDGLPKWLFEAISKCMQKRFSQQRNQSDMDANLRALVLRECLEEIQRMTSPMPQILPHLTFVASGRRSKLT